jgi:hypothetical protein
VVALLGERWIDRVRTNVARQVYPDVELVVVARGLDTTQLRSQVAGWEVPTQVLDTPNGTRAGDRLNLGVTAASGELVALFHEEGVYGPHHLDDLVLALGYAGAEIVGREQHGVYDAQQDQTVLPPPDAGERASESVSAWTMLLRRETALRFGFLRRSRGVDWPLTQRVRAAGGVVYSTHPFDTLLPGRLRGDRSVTDGFAVAQIWSQSDGGVPVAPPAPATEREA